MAQPKPIPFRKRKTVPDLARPTSRIIQRDKVRITGEVVVFREQVTERVA